MSDVTIKVRENGPLKITGPVTIVDADGVPFELPPGSVGRALPLRPLEEQAVLRHDPPEDRLRGRRHGAARDLDAMGRPASGEPAPAVSCGRRYAFAAAFAFFSALRPYCLMNVSVFSCASSSTIWTGGDFIR